MAISFVSSGIETGKEIINEFWLILSCTYIRIFKCKLWVVSNNSGPKVDSNKTKHYFPTTASSIQNWNPDMQGQFPNKRGKKNTRYFSQRFTSNPKIAMLMHFPFKQTSLRTMVNLSCHDACLPQIDMSCIIFQEQSRHKQQKLIWIQLPSNFKLLNNLELRNCCSQPQRECCLCKLTLFY